MVQDAQYLILVPHAILDGVEIHVQHHVAPYHIVQVAVPFLIHVRHVMMVGVGVLARYLDAR